uniref:Uncharacterized protein n=1 Tax=Arundo donax TaxID=35708 RepID=A0A0A9FIT1_ARUDO
MLTDISMLLQNCNYLIKMWQHLR